MIFTDDTDTAAVAVTVHDFPCAIEVNTVDLTADDKESKDGTTPHIKVIGPGKEQVKSKNARVADDPADDPECRPQASPPHYGANPSRDQPAAE